MSHLVIVDGHHLMYRAFYAIPQTLKTSKGELSNAVYGVASMLISLLKAEEPDALIFCFDAGEETFRHKEHAEYKEGRAETPDEFFTQIPRIIQLIESFPIRHASDPKYEADDLLCVYSKEGEKLGMKVTIVTGDRDALQLASSSTRIAIPHKGYQAPEYLDAAGVLAKYGVRPDQIASYKGLTGDASDNLPGVKGIGPKGASALLQKYETLTGIYEHLGEIAPATAAKLTNDRDSAFFCERMATLVCDFPPPIPIADLALEKINIKNAVEFFRAMEFTSLIKRLQTLAQSPYGQKHFVVEKEVAAVSEKTQLTMF